MNNGCVQITCVHSSDFLPMLRMPATEQFQNERFIVTLFKDFLPMLRMPATKQYQNERFIVTLFKVWIVEFIFLKDFQYISIARLPSTS